MGNVQSTASKAPQTQGTNILSNTAYTLKTRSIRHWDDSDEDTLCRQLTELAVDLFHDGIEHPLEIPMAKYFCLARHADEYGKHEDDHLADCILQYEYEVKKQYPIDTQQLISIMKFKIWLGLIKQSTELDQLIQDAYGTELQTMDKNDCIVFDRVLKLDFNK